MLIRQIRKPFNAVFTFRAMAHHTLFSQLGPPCRVTLGPNRQWQNKRDEEGYQKKVIQA
ncbi:MAG: hypothetical protein RH946_21340 [Rhodospirillales bacterium]